MDPWRNGNSYYHPHMAMIVPLLPIPQHDNLHWGPDSDSKFLEEIRKLHEVAISKGSLAIRTGSQHLFDRPLNEFLVLLGEMKMNTAQRTVFDLWMKTNKTSLPRQVYYDLYPIPSRNGLAKSNSQPDMATMKGMNRENIQLELSLQHIFYHHTRVAHPEVVLRCLDEHKDSLLPLVEAVRMVLGERDMMERIREKRGGKWPTAEEIAELFVVRKIVKEIDGKTFEKRAGKMLSKNRETAGDNSGNDEYVSALDDMKKDFKAREDIILRGQWEISGYKQEGQWQEYGAWSRPGL